MAKDRKESSILLPSKNVKEVAASVFISIIISESAFLTISNTEQNMPETDINCSESFIYDKNEIT